MEISALFIATLSFLISVYVVIKDRKLKKIDALYESRKRILEVFDREPTISFEQWIEFDTNPDSPDAQLHKAKSDDLTRKVDREFEFACYLVMCKMINLRSFFNIFHRWLSARNIFWPKYSKYKIANNPNTWWVIQKCKKKSWLPLSGLQVAKDVKT